MLSRQDTVVELDQDVVWHTYVVMAYTVMAYTVMADIVMARMLSDTCQEAITT